ncbi:MAG: hypothetical protein FWF59_08820 [Turicibacter sp.]|nr:hypothetical protein [Turicibacter sp.]
MIKKIGKIVACAFVLGIGTMGTVGAASNVTNHSATYTQGNGTSRNLQVDFEGVQSVQSRIVHTLQWNTLLFRSSTEATALGQVNTGTIVTRVSARQNNRYLVRITHGPNSNGWSGYAWVNAVALGR